MYFVTISSGTTGFDIAIASTRPDKGPCTIIPAAFVKNAPGIKILWRESDI
jgi:hypothetical protein